MIIWIVQLSPHSVDTLSDAGKVLAAFEDVNAAADFAMAHEHATGQGTITTRVRLG